MSDPRAGIYFDNAATSWPKPPEMLAAMSRWLADAGGSPGRSGHRRSVESSRAVEDARQAVADLFRFPDPLRIAFTKNITEALNLAIFSLVKPGSHVVASGGEHNSIMRPLRHLEKTAGVGLTLAETDRHGRWSVESVKKALRPDTALVAVCHASNVTGLRQPAEELWRELADGPPILVDGAQSAGAIPVDLSGAGRLVYAFTGHKSLLGPTGTGGLLMGKDVDLAPLVFGGTGSRSEFDTQPESYPDSLESGTMNVLGLAGLKGSIDYLRRAGLDGIRRHESGLVARFLEGALTRVRGIAVYGTREAEDYLATLSFTLDNLNPSEAGLLLDRRYGIGCRIGLHCNPNCHRAIGTFPDGTVRFSFSPFTTAEEVDRAVAALAEMAELR